MKKRAILLFFCFFIVSPVVFSQEANSQLLEERKLKIEEQVALDLQEELKAIENLSIIGAPTCIISVKRNRIKLFLDTIPALAVIRSENTTVDYARNYYNESLLLFTLQSTRVDTTIRIGRRNDPPLIEYALNYTDSPFYIHAPNHLFLGFGFYDDNRTLKFVGFSNSQPIVFSTVEDFVKHRFGRRYKRYLR